jgi:putative methanogenesis marker protein 8
MDSRDIHVLKYFSSFVSVSYGKVINITEPTLSFCPLADHLYKDFSGSRDNNKEALKNAIKKAIESKIKDYGFFTNERKISSDDVAIPYGASEMISFALRKKAIDAAVIVCEGAGTVITDKPEIVQGIGARMNSLLLTSPIKGIIKKLKTAGCRVAFENALIDQVRGVKDAIKAGYKNIAVTVCGHSAEDLKTLRSLEEENGIHLITLAVCTTGIAKDKVSMIRDYADLVWSCASFNIRRMLGPLAVLQLSRQIPIFVLTKKGIDFISTYAREGEIIKNLDIKKQYLVSNEPSGQCVHLGSFKTFISESKLPVNARKEPSFEDKNEYASV